MKNILIALIAATMAFGAMAEQKKDEKKAPPVAEKKAEPKKDEKKPPVAEKKAEEEKKNIGPRNRQTKKEQEKGDTSRLDANKK